jgi:ribonuclease HI
MKKQKFYVVWNGRQTGIFKTWAEAEAQVKGFAGAQYKAFDTRAEAERALAHGPVARGSRAAYITKPAERWTPLRMLGIEPPILPSYCADAACSGNPGVLEYRCVHTETGEILFARGPFAEGTNNIGEFLAIVEALMLLCQKQDAAPIYSDSANALSWVKQKKCKTQLAPSTRNAKLFQRIARAETWLRENRFPNKILKWDTENWGENPADYGRK